MQHKPNPSYSGSDRNFTWMWCPPDTIRVTYFTRTGVQVRLHGMVYTLWYRKKTVAIPSALFGPGEVMQAFLRLSQQIMDQLSEAVNGS